MSKVDVFVYVAVVTMAVMVYSGSWNKGAIHNYNGHKRNYRNIKGGGMAYVIVSSLLGDVALANI